MKSVKWTKEQLTAINQEGCNLLVAAAAGAGKTAVLVERIIRKVTQDKPVDIDKLLVVTFTNAAAAEMKERVGKALEEALEENPASELLQRQMLLLDKASIMTIHSFCLEVVRNNFHMLEIDPTFRIADETEVALMKSDALEELFESRYEDENTSRDFYRLVDSYGGSRSDTELQSLVLRLFEFTRSSPWPQNWLDKHTWSFRHLDDFELTSSPWAKIVLESIKLELAGAKKDMEHALDLACTSDGIEPYVPTLEDDILQIDSLIKVLDNGGDWDEMFREFSAFTPSRLSRCKKYADKDAQQRVKDARDRMKASISGAKEKIFNARSEEIKEDLITLYPLISQLNKGTCQSSFSSAAFSAKN
jgi:ATP-dependent helicase/nuclease subunit A